MDQTEDSLEDIAALKAKLEVEKLKMEIRFQKNPFKNPQNIAPFATLLGTCFALIWAISTGWFTNQNDKLEIRNHKLEEQRIAIQTEIDRFTAEKKSISDSLFVLGFKLKLADSANQQAGNILSVLQDSLKTVDEKRKYVSDKFISLQRENFKLKLENQTLKENKNGMNYPQGIFTYRVLKALASSNVDSAISILELYKEFDSIALKAHY